MGIRIVFLINVDVRVFKKDLDNAGCVLLGINCHMEHRETIGGLLLDVGLVIEEKTDCVGVPVQYGITEGRIAVNRSVDVITTGHVLEVISSEGPVSDPVCDDVGHGDSHEVGCKGEAESEVRLSCSWKDVGN